MTREELMAMRAEAEKHWRAGRTALDAVAPGPLSLSPGEEKILAAYLDANVGPLPAPEPQQVTGPSGETYRLFGGRPTLYNDTRLHVSPVDRATVANLLCPFEDVVRATLEELGAIAVDCGPTWGKAVRGDNGSWPGFTRETKAHLSRILKRLESR